ncbi:MlaD family protein [Streptomyces lydicus]|uniref:MlaD family protein n=1 Tax=Streptomyces lydicus TaxID=47763 RepID=UPI00342C6C3A
MKTVRPWTRPFRSPVLTGGVILVLAVVTLLAVYQKIRIATELSSGQMVKAEFTRDYRLVPHKTQVKVAGIAAGTVTDVQPGPHGHAVVSMKLHDGVTTKLGSAPSAIVRPTTLIGGNYYVQLTPGGSRQPYAGGTIPASRTSVPVELDQVLTAVPQTARESIQNTARLTDKTLSKGAGEALNKVLQDAPGTLAPAASVLAGLQGTRPGDDLSQLVTNLDAVAAVTTKSHGQLGDIVDSLEDVSTTLSNTRQPVTRTLASLPQTLSSTKAGLTALTGSLKQLTTTATAARPSAQALGPLLTSANPVLRRARPLVRNLRPLLRTAAPVVRQLVPTSKQATSTLNDIRGPVLDRINGPISKTVLSPWKGTGPYKGDGGNGHLFYEEVGYLFAHAANLSKYGDKNGRLIGLALGAGVSTAGGNDIGTAKMLQELGLLPGGGVKLVPPRSNANNSWTDEPATSPGQDDVLTGPLGSLLGDGHAGSQGKQGGR